MFCRDNDLQLSCQVLYSTISTLKTFCCFSLLLLIFVCAMVACLDPFFCMKNNIHYWNCPIFMKHTALYCNTYTDAYFYSTQWTYFTATNPFNISAQYRRYQISDVKISGWFHNILWNRGIMSVVCGICTGQSCFFVEY